MCSRTLSPGRDVGRGSDRGLDHAPQPLGQEFRHCEAPGRGRQLKVPLPDQAGEPRCRLLMGRAIDDPASPGSER
jgi:hypothetical protein